MRKYGKWALTLGLLAATPAFTQFAAAQGRGDPPSAQKPAANYNQQMAEKIANALRAQRLAAYEVEIEFQDGIAIIKGMIVDKRQKKRAHDAVAKVPGVTQVDDSRLAILPKQSLGDRLRGKPSEVVQAGHQHSGHDGRVQQVNSEAEHGPAAAIHQNQRVANEIGSALSQADLDGYDIEIRYQNGVAMLEGKVPTNAQRAQAEHIAGEIAGVQSVANRLQVTDEQPLPQQPGRGPMMAPGGMDPRMMAQQGMDPRLAMMQQGMDPRMAMAQQQGMDPRMMMAANGVDPRFIPANYQAPPPPPPGYPAGPGVPPGYPAGPGLPPGAAPVPPPVPYAHPGPGPNSPMYTQPHLPQSAWPAYAQYPNSAAVTYPQQYSASAWPYIGPFYPYPQVPLGWRDATLRWDDGFWNLQFRQRTDKWWWFLHPKNWGDNE